MDSDYVKVFTNKSFCPQCERPIVLIQDRKLRASKPMFYICCACQFIAEVGKGEVTEQ